MQENWVQSLGWEDPLEKGKVTQSSILAWRIPQTVQPMGSQSWTRLSDFHFSLPQYDPSKQRGKESSFTKAECHIFAKTSQQQEIILFLAGTCHLTASKTSLTGVSPFPSFCFRHQGFLNLSLFCLLTSNDIFLLLHLTPRREWD